MSTVAPSSAVFRVPPLVLVFAVFLALCATPVALGPVPHLWVLYLVPLAVAVWTLRVRTTVDADALTVRGVLRSRRVPWSQISTLALGPRTRVRAVLQDGAELPLPSVHVRDLPRLAAASGGRLPDPAGEA